jgi:hypothetical protein
VKVLIVKRKLFGLIPYSHEVERPRISKIRASVKTKMPNPLWKCEGGGWIGCGETPAKAWNDWANWALI